MRIGAASAPLAIPLGTAMGGYADRTGGATGTLDELQVSCVQLGGLTLVVADMVCAHADLAEAVAAAIGGGPVWTAATHTHSGPDLDCGPGVRATPPAWLAAIPQAAAVAAARITPVESTLAWHAGEVRDVGSVRARTDAPPSVPVDVLAARSRDGALHGVLVVLPVHPTVLPAANTDVSADLAGAVRRAVQQRLGPEAWVVVATGCAGDISTRATRRAQTADECARLGELAAAQILDILATDPIRVEAGDPAVRVETRALRLPVRPAESLEEPDSDDRIAYTFRQGLAVARERAARHPDGIATLRVGAAQLGTIRLAALGAEPYLAVRSMVDGVVLGYTNGYAGYLPDADAFTAPSYEVLSSPFRPDAAGLATRAINEMSEAEERDD